MDGLVNSRI